MDTPLPASARLLTAPAPAADADRTREESMVWIGGCVVLAVLWVVILLVGVQRTELERSERRALAASTAKGFAEYVSLHLLNVDHILMQARDDFERSGAVAPHEQLARTLGPMAPMLLQLAFADAQGRIVASSLPLQAKGQVSVADRPHFLEFRNDPRDRLHLSEPVVGRVSGKMSLQLVRPLRGPAGEFRGIAVASIDPIRLQQYFASLEAFQDGGTVLIAGRHDGIVRTRFSGSDITWGESMKASRAWSRLSRETAGEYETLGAIDGRQRLVGFHEVAGYPLFVVVTALPPRWLSPEMVLALALGIAFTIIKVNYLRSRVRRVRENQLLIEQLRQSERREMEASRMKSRFLASVSHELRTPLNAILGFSELVRDMPEHRDTVRRAELIHTSGKHLHALLNTLLDLAKIEAGRMSLQRAELDLVDTVKTVVETHAAGAQRKGLAVAVTSGIPERCRAMADTDGTKYVQVLNNVLHNAVKFTKAGRIEVKMHLEGDDTLVVQVLDTGRGIAPAQLPHVFDRFSTASCAGSHREEGTGLGLALSRELMRLLGGSIELASRERAGTQVTIKLPGVRLAPLQP